MLNGKEGDGKRPAVAHRFACICGISRAGLQEEGHDTDIDNSMSHHTGTRGLWLLGPVVTPC